MTAALTQNGIRHPQASMASSGRNAISGRNTTLARKFPNCVPLCVQLV